MTAAASPTLAPAAANAYPEVTGRRNVAPIVAAVDGSAASRAAVETAVRLGAEMDAPVVFVNVRRGPAGFFGTPVYQRLLTKKMAHARRVLDRALAIAARAGVPAEGEILEGVPRRRIPEFARDRGARLVVVGSRKRRLGRSVSSGVAHAAGRPAVVARSCSATRGGGVAMLVWHSLLVPVTGLGRLPARPLLRPPCGAVFRSARSWTGGTS